MRKVLLAFAVVISAHGLRAAATTVPTIDQLIELKRPGGVAISPDGKRVAFTVTETNWEENAYETEIFLADSSGGPPIQLTRAKKSSSAPAWAPDGRTLAFISDRTDKRQIYLIDPAGGEARALTATEDGVNAFAWSPDGRHIAFTMTEPKTDAIKERDKRYGEFDVVDHDYRMTHLYLIEVDPQKTTPAEPKRLTKGSFTVGSFDWSPDGKAITFDHRIDPNLANGGTADISIVTMSDSSVRTLVTQDGPDTNPKWSPDGSQIAFESAMANQWFFYSNSRIAVVPARGGAPKSISDRFDEQPSIVAWTPTGIIFSGLEKTSSRLFRLNPTTAEVTRVIPATGASIGSYSFSRDFSSVAFVSSDAKSFPEVYIAPAATMTGRKLTTFADQISGWTVGNREVISWKSTDGTTIEGVLHKPADFQPGRRYPLLVVIHGGPTGISRPVRVQMGGTYPIELWLAKGAVVLEPNYRGSAGYGEKFRSLNVRNLGVGDAWDVLSGVDDLVAQGIADPARMGVMGWSQGGYISAFLATHERQPFKAISVGAGISDWLTYYVNTDIHPFTRQYLKATPWDDPAIYAKTSPITTIRQAKTPTLIQHGENDQRVPIPNAYELYQGLQDQGVPVKLIVYKGFGHGLNKPKAARAAMEHNLEWFNQYVFGERPSTTPAAERDLEPVTR
jgi:dipeptidyl aminopeptidase/acylaminoacyl peptidase